MNDPTAADWRIRYVSGSTPWDLRRPHPELVTRLSELGPPGRVVVPGAGRGHDARALADGGWSVVAIELVPELESDLANAVGPAGSVVIGDALAWGPTEPVDLLFDHTFFCALPPRLRPDLGAWAAEVVRPGGRVASVVFPYGREPAAGGPPFGMSAGDLAAALGDRFELVEDVPALHPSGRGWKTRWAEFVRVAGRS